MSSYIGHLIDAVGTVKCCILPVGSTERTRDRARQAEPESRFRLFDLNE